MVPTLQCGLVRSNFCLAMWLLSGSSISGRYAGRRGQLGGVAVLDRNDWPVNRNSRPGLQSRPGGSMSGVAVVVVIVSLNGTRLFGVRVLGLRLLVAGGFLRRLQLLYVRLQGGHRT